MCPLLYTLYVFLTDTTETLTGHLEFNKDLVSKNFFLFSYLVVKIIVIIFIPLGEGVLITFGPFFTL